MLCIFETEKYKILTIKIPIKQHSNRIQLYKISLNKYKGYEKLHVTNFHVVNILHLLR